MLKIVHVLTHFLYEAHAFYNKLVIIIPRICRKRAYELFTKKTQNIKHLLCSLRIIRSCTSIVLFKYLSYRESVACRMQLLTLVHSGFILGS